MFHKGQGKFRFGNTGYRNRTRLRFGFVTTIHSAPEQSATRERTRKAILDAAVSVFASKPAATLSEIASAAKVGRTTLHRYFPERSDLVDAVAAEATRAVGEAAAAARLGEGTGAEALVRLCHEYFELADLLTVLFFTPGVYQEDSFAESASNDDSVTDAIERGHSDGSIDPDMGSDWVQNLLWSLLYTSMDYVNRGSGTRLQALDLTVRSLRRGIAPDPAV